MRLRRFTAKHPREALAQVKATLGPEAVILATRPLDDGGVEITAAVDLDDVVAVPVTSPGVDAVAPATVARELEALAARVAHLDSTLASRLDRVLASRGHRPLASPRDGTVAPVPERDGLDDEAGALAERLVLHGTSFALADATARSFARARRKGETAAAALAASVARHLVAPGPAAASRVTAFVGPTGSGKTTTIAKLAAQALARGCSVGLVMADTHRIAAAEQLGTYARLLEVPMRTVRDRDELAAALAAFADRDAVYVDTAGLTGDAAVADEVAHLFTGAGGGDDGAVATIAVVPANASETAWRRMWRQLDRLGPVASVVTKVDERAGFGAACAWLSDVGVPLAWLGTGTRVPDDLVAADASAVAAWLTAA